jgi:sarcosine oxidase/L-pipecolate oxidase
MGSYEPHKSIGGLYGLPRTPEGVVKFGFRGSKWTNYSRTNTSTGTAISVPKTNLAEVPEEAMRVCRAFCAENLPDLLDLELEQGRLCWYTDSVDNNFLISQIPNVDNLFVASGGSGHGFKFLPVLGKHVVDVIERKDTPYTRLFAWREVPRGQRNGLEEGPDGWRTLDKQRLVGKGAWRKASAL